MFASGEPRPVKTASENVVYMLMFLPSLPSWSQDFTCGSMLQDTSLEGLCAVSFGKERVRGGGRVERSKGGGGEEGGQREVRKEETHISGKLLCVRFYLFSYLSIYLLYLYLYSYMHI